MDIPRRDIKPKKKHGKFNVLLFIVLVFIIISTSVAAYLNLNEIDIKETSVKELFKNKFYLKESLKNKKILLEMAYDGSTNAKFTICEGYIVKCTQDKIDFIDKKGEIKKTFYSSFKNPLIKTSGDYLLIADIKGKDIFVSKGINELWKKEFDKNIINADINEKGHVTVIHEEDRSRNAASVFNDEGTRYFIDNSGDEFILSANVSPKGEEVLLNYAITSGVNATTDLKKYNIKSKQETVKRFEEEFFALAKYVDDELIMVSGDLGITILDNELKEKWNIPVNGSVYDFDLIKGRYISVAVRTGNTGFFSNGKSDVLVYGMDGEEITNFTIEDRVKSLRVSDDIIAINSAKMLYIANTDGKIINEYSFKTEIEHIEFFNKKEILVIVENKIVILNIS